MFANALTSFWSLTVKEHAAPQPPCKRPAPVFIGDAVQPWAGETMLLSVLRQQAEDENARSE
ncbi:MAG: hypothetical protein V2I76_02965 [Roseobacter sp.]|jgi:hypothetical protein|nr:hypothetical protein [Roseobacter sp.]